MLLKNSSVSSVIHLLASPANSEEECLRPNNNLSHTGNNAFRRKTQSVISNHHAN
jgi:hypothetical protein